MFISHHPTATAWTAMWWTTSMSPTCQCTLKRESGRSKFSTVEQLPWQLVVLISMLQRVRGESLIISAWQRGPTDRAKVKRKSLRSTWEPQLLISSCSAQSCVKLWGGEKSGASLCYSLFSFFLFLSSPLLSFSQTCSTLPILTPTQQIHTHNNKHLFLSKEMGQVLSISGRLPHVLVLKGGQTQKGQEVPGTFCFIPSLRGWTNIN